MVSYVLHLTCMRNITYNSFAGEGETDGIGFACVYMYMCSSAHDCGCMVDGSNAMGAS